MSIVARILLVVLCLSVLTLPAAHAQAPQPFRVYTPLALRNANGLPPPNYRIAFVGLYGRLSTIRADRTEATVLTESDVVRPDQPSWSPDGTTLAFWGTTGVTATTGIYTVPADGHAAPRLIYPTATPLGYQAIQWSPDGHYLAFTDTITTTQLSVVLVMRPDGRDVHRLSAKITSTSDPIWSPDGTQLAFRAGTPTNLYFVHPDGTHLQQVTTSMGIGTYAWSPDGTQLVFTTYPGNSLYRVQRDGTQLQLLAPIGSTSPLSWSPDGTALLYTQGDGIVRFDLASHQSTVVGLGRAPQWSPDGTQIAFIADRTAYVMRRDGTERHIISGLWGVDAVVWSPDGSRVLATQYDRISRNLFVLGVDGRAASVVGLGAISYEGVWSPRE